MTVPADHESPQTSSKLKIHIRKMCSTLLVPIWNIIILPGGPGQSCKIYIDMISHISGSLSGASYCLYAVDHRSVGKSKPKLLEEKDNEKWLEKIDELSKRTDFPLKTLTITNAAKDVLVLAEYLRESMPNSKLGLIGQSYGSMLAHRVLSVDPNMFDSCILDGYAVFEFYPNDNDDGLILDCKDNPTCTKKLGSNPENIRFVPSYLFNRDFNACTRILHNLLDENHKISTEEERKYWFQKFFSPWSIYSGYHRFLIAIIHHTWTCPDPEIYEKALKKFDMVHRDQNEQFESSVKSSDPNRIQGPDMKEMNIFVNKYLRVSEISRVYMKNESEPVNCTKRNYPVGLHHRCGVWAWESLEYQRMKPYLYDPDYSNLPVKTCKKENIFWRILKWIWEGLKRIWKFITFIFSKKSSNSSLNPIHSKLITHNIPPINTEKTEIYLIHGGFDLNTPVALALREFDRIRAPGKRKFIFKNQGHCVAFYNSCRFKIMSEIFDEGSKDETDKCIKDSNANDDSSYSWEMVDQLNLWAQDKNGNDGNLKSMPNRPFGE